MNASDSHNQSPKVPKEAGAILETTFQRILAEATFADAWPLPGDSDPSAIASAELVILVPLTAPWNGSVMIGATEATAADLAAGFHSLPDAMVDRALTLEFLAELAEMLARDVFCASDVPVESGQPTEPKPETARKFWETAAEARCVLGCNGTGRMYAALVADN